MNVFVVTIYCGSSLYESITRAFSDINKLNLFLTRLDNPNDVLHEFQGSNVVIRECEVDEACMESEKDNERDTTFLPCWFCGKQDSIVAWQDDADIDGMWAVSCDVRKGGCGATKRCLYGDKNNAIAVWNTRLAVAAGSIENNH